VPATLPSRFAGAVGGRLARATCAAALGMGALGMGVLACTPPAFADHGGGPSAGQVAASKARVARLERKVAAAADAVSRAQQSLEAARTAAEVAVEAFDKARVQQAASVHALSQEDAAWGRPLCPHRPFLAAEAVHALRAQGAVTFADLLLRRLVHSQGPCLDDECLQRAHALFVQQRRWPADGEYAPAAAALRQEVDRLSGGLVPAAVAFDRAPR